MTKEGEDTQLTQVLTLIQQNMTRLTNINNDTRSKSKRPDRPVIEASIDDRELALFEDSWARYKTIIGLSSDVDADLNMIRIELRQCCSSEVNKMLFEFVGANTLDRCTEIQLLSHIKSVAVKSVHQNGVWPHDAERGRNDHKLCGQIKGESVPMSI